MVRRSVILCISIVFVFAGVVSLSAEDRPLTVEQLYLEDDIGIQVLRTQALSVERMHKENALRTLREMVENGAVGPNDSGRIGVLRLLATDGSSYQVRTGGRVIYNYHDIRRDATELLGRIGGNQVRHVLREILQYEREPMVLAEAVYALGEIGMDGQEAIARRLESVLIREQARDNSDRNLMYVTLRAIEKIAQENTEGLTRDALINSLVSISTGPYPAVVRDQARDTLNMLAGL